MNKLVLLVLAFSMEAQRALCSVVFAQVLGSSQVIVKRLVLASFISSVILWVCLHFLALSWSLPASLRRVSMLCISFWMLLWVLSLGSSVEHI